MKLKMNVIKFMLFALLFVGANYAQAQRTIKGKVTDGSEALIGANVVLKGTSKGAVTDGDGMYSISVPATGGVLVFSYTGFNEQSVPLGASNNLDVVLKAGTVIDEVVVQAYGQVKKTDITGSVVAINEKDFNKGAVASPEQLIAGRVAGLSVVTTSGEPGAQSVARIRGGTSISASNDPLYVIDGVPIYNEASTADGVVNASSSNPLSMLNANDIESVSVLKDASATAIYGSRGANGVIIITTKSGKDGKTTVDYNASYGVATIAKKLDLLTADEFRAKTNELVAAGKVTQAVATESLGKDNTDWQAAILRSAKVQNHDLSFGGGNANTTFRASLGYQGQEGIVVGTGLNRLSGRLSVNQKAINNRLDITMRVNASQVATSFAGEEETPGYQGGMFAGMIKSNPTRPIKLESGDYFNATERSNQNPVSIANLVLDKANTTRILTSIGAAFKLTDDLTARVNASLDNSNGARNFYAPTNTGYGAEFGGRAVRATKEVQSKLLESTLEYRRSIGDNQNLSVLAGYSWQDFAKQGFRAETRNFLTNLFTYNSLSGGLNNTVAPTSYYESSKLISFFGRATYDFAGKYLLTATVRQDGSSRFGANKKNAIFPSFALGWRISEEGFLKGNATLTNLKLRASWGVTGSQEIGNYLSSNLLRVDPTYLAAFGQGTQVVNPGVAAYQVPNPDIQWESTKQSNIGLDFDLLGGKISGVVDVYQKNTDNLLINYALPAPTVVPSQIRNVGKLSNKGIELTLNANLLNKANMGWNIGANISSNVNKVVALDDPTAGLSLKEIRTGRLSGSGLSDEYSQVLRVGEQVGAFNLFKFDKVVNGVQQGFNAKGESVPLKTLKPEDRQIVGYALPKFTYGFNTTFNYAGLDLGLFFRGSQGGKVFNNTALEYQSLSRIPKQNIIDPSTDPIKAAISFESDAIPSSLWLEDGSFLRLDNATLGYKVPVKGAFRTVRVFVTGQNLICLTKYTGYDPEINTNADLNNTPSIGIDRVNYPKARTILFGIGIGF
jgi:TonB-dependent starch-binding outer membrane protein SusC